MKLFDLLALNVATAVGIALAFRFYERCSNMIDPATGGEFYLGHDRVARVCVWFTVVTPLIAAWTIGLLTLRFVPPRPPLRRMFRQPGLVALFGASASMMILMSLTIAAKFYMFYRFWFSKTEDQTSYVLDKMMDSIIGTLGLAGLVVAVAWAIQALGGRWRAEPDWIDRAGRVLGVVWIAQLPLCLYTMSIIEGY